MNPVEVGQAALPAMKDMSFWNLFLLAHPVVQAVMVGLLLASIVSWAIMMEKGLMYRRLRQNMDRFEQVFWSGQSLEELYRTLSPRTNHGMAALFVAAMREWHRTKETGGRGIGGLKERIDRVMDVTISREAERLESRLIFLASLGSSAPFIGLFGTVWGIMTAFLAIGVSQNTSLVVVAPAIAEALFATAIGLVAAIPAVVAYNKLQADVAKQVGRMEGFADEFSAIISRQIDERLAA
jgi:biopolymer transport protein TolQ